MKPVELRKKTEKELQDMERNLKEKGRDLRFQLAAGKVKNVREIRLTKKSIAQLKTILQEKRVEPLFEKKVSLPAQAGNRQKIQGVSPQNKFDTHD